MVTLALALMWGLFVAYGPISTLPLWQGLLIAFLGGVAITAFAKD